MRAGHVAARRPAGQEVDENHEEVSSVGNFGHERELGHQLHSALPGHAEPYRDDVRHRWQRRRWSRPGGLEAFSHGGEVRQLTVR